jgi:hypothetical protein
MTQTIKNNRDTNEREIIDLLRKIGCVVWQMDRTAGFDLLVISAGDVEIVEIKNPAHKWKLTEAEAKKKAEVESVGGVYWIVTDEDDALKMAYATKRV